MSAPTMKGPLLLETRIDGRVLARDVTLSDGTEVPVGTKIGEDLMKKLRDDPAVNEIMVARAHV